MTEEKGSFVGSLLWLVDERNSRAPDRGVLAALRSGSGRAPGEASRMFPIVAPFLTNLQGANVEAMFLTASLFASHPVHAEEIRGTRLRSLGHSLWWATKSEGNPEGKHGSEGVERRLAAALDADPDDLPHHLQGLVSLCESARTPINWYRFMDHVQSLLSRPTERFDPTAQRDHVRMEWARDFWRGPQLNSQNQEATE